MIFTFAIVALLVNLKMKVVEVVKDQKIIFLTIYQLLPWGQKEKTIYRVKEGDRLAIW